MRDLLPAASPIINYDVVTNFKDYEYILSKIAPRDDPDSRNIITLLSQDEFDKYNTFHEHFRNKEELIMLTLEDEDISKHKTYVEWRSSTTDKIFSKQCQYSDLTVPKELVLYNLISDNKLPKAESQILVFTYANDNDWLCKVLNYLNIPAISFSVLMNEKDIQRFNDGEFQVLVMNDDHTPTFEVQLKLHFPSVDAIFHFNKIDAKCFQQRLELVDREVVSCFMLTEDECSELRGWIGMEHKTLALLYGCSINEKVKDETMKYQLKVSQATTTIGLYNMEYFSLKYSSILFPGQDQGDSLNCSMFAALSCISATYAKEKGIRIQLSVQQVLDEGLEVES